MYEAHADVNVNWNKGRGWGRGEPHDDYYVKAGADQIVIDLIKLF